MSEDKLCVTLSVDRELLLDQTALSLLPDLLGRIARDELAPKLIGVAAQANKEKNDAETS